MLCTNLILNQHRGPDHGIVALIKPRFPYQDTVDVRVVVFEVLPALGKLGVSVQCHTLRFSIGLDREIHSLQVRH